MKFQNSIIASALVSFVCAAPFVEGKHNKAVFPSNSGPLESNSINFNDAAFVPRSVLRKRETEASNEAAKAVDRLFEDLYKGSKDFEYRNKEGRIPELVKDFESAKEIVKTAKDGKLEGKLAYIEKTIETFKEINKMDNIFEGCKYPGAELIDNILEVKVYALQAANAVGEEKEGIIAFTEKTIETESRKNFEVMAPALRRMYDTKVEELKDILKSLKEDTLVEKELSSGTDASRDEKKTCPEIGDII